MAINLDRCTLAFDVMHYAHEKALEAIKDMPPGPERVCAFVEAWEKAAEEYVNAYQP